MPFPNEIRPGTPRMDADTWIRLKEEEAEERLPGGDMGIFPTGFDSVSHVSKSSYHPSDDDRQSTDIIKPQPQGETEG